MTLDHLLALARKVDECGSGDSDSERLARGVLELLGEAQPCGWEEPEAGWDGNDPIVIMPSDWMRVEFVSPTDARHMARMLLRAADAADKEGM